MTISEYMAGIQRAESPETVRELMQRAAREGVLEFPVVLVGNRVKIPREAFVRYMEGRHDGL